MQIEIRKNKKKGKVYFVVVAGNRAVMHKSKLYANKRSLAESLAVLKAGLSGAQVVDRV